MVALGDYSTSEVETAFEWIDGKRIFKKTVTGTVTVAAQTRALIVLSVPNIDNLIAVDGWVQINAIGYCTPVNSTGWGGSSVNSPVTNYSAFQKRPNEVYFLSQYDDARTNAPYQIAFSYTKT